jgi:hypothetical protein
VISTAELASMQATVAQTFTSTATLYRKSSTPDGAGGQTDSYTVVAAYPCSIGKFPVRPFEAERSQMIQAVSEWQFVFARTVVVQPTDRIDCEGRHFEVVGSGVGSFDLVNKVICIEIL